MRLFIFIFLCITITQVNAQRTCGSIMNLSDIQQNDPTRYQRIMQIERHTERYVNRVRGASSHETVITIPVVVHVLHTGQAIGTGLNISHAQIQSQIDVLNEDFRRLNADTTNTPQIFRHLAADIKIQFVLASRDPNGQPTNGVVRKRTTKDTFIIRDNDFNNMFDLMEERDAGIKFTPTGSPAWPTNRYLNIWVCNELYHSFLFISTNLAGYAQFPDQLSIATSPQTDGVVINTNVFGGIGYVNVSSLDRGRTTTHEVGHWLNLKHIWGDTLCGNDMVDDTPVQESSSSSSCPPLLTTSSCNGSSHDIMFQNYMDYTDDECMNLFTHGQKNRMRALFSQSGAREQLLTALAYIAGPNSICSNLSQTFSLENLPRGFIATWTVSPGVQIVSLSETQVTIRTIGSSGNRWVRATLSNGMVLTKNFQYQTYSPLTMYVSRNGSCSRIFAYLAGGPLAGSTGGLTLWYLNGQFVQRTVGQNAQSAQFSYSSNTGTLRAVQTDQCNREVVATQTFSLPVSLSINGPNSVCSGRNKTFSIQYSGCTPSVNRWEFSNNVRRESSPYVTSSITVTTNSYSSDQGWVKAILSDGREVTRTFGVQGYRPLGFSVSKNHNTCTISASVSGGPGVSIRWYLNGRYQKTAYGNTSFSYSSNTGTLRAVQTNQCGREVRVTRNFSFSSPSSYSISGPSSFCSGQNRTFTLQSVPSCLRSSATWSSSSNAQIVSRNNHQGTIRARSSGSGWVRARLSSGQVLTKSFSATGGGSLSLYTGGGQVGPYGQLDVRVSGGVPPYRYYRGSSLLRTTSNAQVTLAFGCNGGTLRVTAQGSCGGTLTGFTTIQQCGNYYYTTYPNPASSTLTIEEQIDLEQYEHSARYELYNFQGEIVSQGTIETLTTIDLSSFERGRYILRIYTGDRVENHNIIIN